MSVVDRSILITGSSRGLGLAASKKLATQPGVHLLMLSRDPDAGLAAAEALQRESGNPNIHHLEIDLSSLRQVRDFGSNFVSYGFPPLSALLCNAAVQPLEEQHYSEEGFELAFAVNYLAHYLLTALLLPKLTLPSRVIFTGCPTSLTHPLLSTLLGQPEPRYRTPKTLAHPERYPDFGFTRSYPDLGRMRYVTSKQCLIAYALEVARRLASLKINGVTVNIYDPVLLPGSALFTHPSKASHLAWDYLWPMMRPLVPGAADLVHAGEDLAWLATDPSLQSVSGKYFNQRTPLQSPDCWLSQEESLDLYLETARLCELTEMEDPFVNASWITRRRHAHA